MKSERATILAHDIVSPCFRRMRIKSAYLARHAKPGQFVEVRCSDARSPLLRRPFGVHRIRPDGIEIFYEVVGAGTALLARKARGDTADIIGPLGNGFDTGGAGDNAILVAGGIGVAPLVALAEGLAGGKKRRLTVLIGARTKSHIVCAQDFRKLGAKVIITTDDGSLGTEGFVTAPLTHLLSTVGCDHSIVYACGPTVMLKTVAAMAAERDIPCQVSLEERMACGVGVCRGCPVKVRKDLVDTEYRMVCKDGPVFDARLIVW